MKFYAFIYYLHIPVHLITKRQLMNFEQDQVIDFDVSTYGFSRAFICKKYRYLKKNKNVDNLSIGI